MASSRLVGEKDEGRFRAMDPPDAPDRLGRPALSRDGRSRPTGTLREIATPACSPQAGARFVGLHGRPSGFLELVSHPVVRKFNYLSLEVHADTNLFVFDLFAQSSKHL